MTQFGRALHALNIDIICANSSQAKGRVERAHKTLQDRLVRERRLAGVRTLAEGNALLPAFIADYNARFAKLPANQKDLHRPLRTGDDLEDAFAWQEERRLSQALTLQYDKVIFILEPSEPAKAAINKYVTVFDYPDGRLVIRYRGAELAYRTFDKVRQVDQGAIADNKRLGPVLAMIRDQQLRRGRERRSGPRRRDQRDTRLFKLAEGARNGWTRVAESIRDAVIVQGLTADVDDFRAHLPHRLRELRLDRPWRDSLLITQEFGMLQE